MNIRVLDAEVSVSLSYWDSWMAETQATNVASSFSAALKNILCNTETVGQIDLFSSHHKLQIQEWNRTYTEPVRECVHETIEKQVTLRPKRLAITSWDGEFTYEELNMLADRLAHHLRSLGLENGSYVPLCFDKSAWTIVAMLAVLKAGGACISVSPAFPVTRLEKIVHESNAHIVLVAPQHSHLFSNIAGQVVEVTASLMQQIPEIQGSVHTTVTSQNPAFVLFTSGSTGEPKGIVLEHGAICTSVSEHGPALQINADSRVLQFSAYIYDVSFGEIFTTLMRGGCVCVPSEEERVNGLSDVMNRLEVTWAFLTPTVAGLLNPEEVKTLKVLALGGEFATKDNVESWSTKVYLINTYGPAECAIWCSYQPGLRIDSSPNNAGRTTGSRRWVVDPNDHNLLVPIGCVGELLVEGPILARGYLNDIEKTSNAFIEHPHWLSKGYGAVIPSRRFYKTGDLVRYNSDGTIDIIGRKDTQIKLHGQRIELGEIEYHLRRAAPEKWQISVELIKIAEKSLLAAFFGLNEGQDSHTFDALPVTLALRETMLLIQSDLIQALPRYMVPTAYIPLTTIPLTAGGKTNRKMLKEISRSMTPEKLNSLSPMTTGKTPPATPIQKQLQELWAATLTVDPKFIGVKDNFFHIGGDSLYAMKLVAAARKIGLGITIAAIFHHPTLSKMADELVPFGSIGNTQLSTFDLLQISLDSKAKLRVKAAQLCSIPESTVQDIYPCTPLQDGLMALSIKNHGSYVSQSVYRLPVDIDIGRFKTSWEAVFKQVDILRTRIIEDVTSSSLLQVVVDESIQWYCEPELEKYLEKDRKHPVGLGKELVRFALAGLVSTSQYFIWTIHHTLYDGWSKDLILNAVHAHYQGIETTQLAPFKQFIHHLGTFNSNASAKFWRSQLSQTFQNHFPSLPSVDYQAQTDRRDFHRVKFLRAQRATSSITSSTIIRAAWAIIVGRYSSTNDVVYGTILSGRHANGFPIESIVGPTITTVPVRCRIDKSASVVSFLKQVQQDAAEIFAHEQYGLQNIRRLGPEVQEASNFQNLLIVNGVQAETPDSNLFNECAIPGHQADFLTYPLTIECTPSSDGLEVVAQYDSRLISSEQISRLVKQFEHVLGQLAAESPQAIVNDVEIISSQDKLDILNWNSQPLERTERCVHHLVEERAHTQPNAVAVCSWDGQLTYAELDETSNRLANHLIEIGVRASVIVPFCFSKSIWAVVATLAILKAGGCFVAIDPTHPTSRLETIIAETKATISIMEPKHARILQYLTKNTIVLDNAFIDSLPMTEEHPKSDVSPQDPAVVVFTSGSTGVPKGIVLEHAALSSSIAAHGPILQINTASRVLQFASYTFDVSIGEMFTTLIMGGCVCIPSDEDRLNNLAGAINSLSVNWANLTPSVATLIDPDETPHLKTLVLSGEAPTSENVSTWSTKVHLINIYGPAECSIWSMCLPVVEENSQATNIGYGVGSRSWVVDVDDNHRLAPVGCVGELLIEGPILARGYLNDDKKTASSFISHPDWLRNASESSSYRAYKTGDLVRYNPDGSVIYIGRKDMQVKLHGQRIELPEIEHQIAASTLTSQVMVALPGSGLCKNQLVAVLTLKELPPTLANGEEWMSPIVNTIVTSRVSTLSELASQTLPPYMIPSLWVVVYKMPLGTSGKLHRKQILERLETIDKNTLDKISSITATRIIQAPESRNELLLQSVWSQVLNVQIDDANKSFFSLGGDSITAMQVVSRCRKEGIAVTVQDIIRCKTISKLALCALPIHTAILFEQEDDGNAFQLSPIQEMFFNYSPNGENHFNQSFLLRLTKSVDITIISHALDLVVRRHPMLAARFKCEDRQWTQFISADLVKSYSFESHQIGSRNKIEAIQRAAHAKIDIQNGPVLAVDLVSINDDEDIIHLVAHHLVIDLVSWRIILQELEEYLQEGEPATPESSGLSFRSWCKLQSDHVRTLNPSHLEASIDLTPSNYAYWGMDCVPNLYSDTVSETFLVGQVNTAKLMGECNAALDTEPLDIMLCALIASFQHTFPHRSTPPIFNEGHGRQSWDPASIDLSSTVGWFTTFAPISVSTKKGHGILDILRQVKDARRQMSGAGLQYLASSAQHQESSEALQKTFPPEVIFNYSGRYQQLENEGAILRPASDVISTAPQIGPSMPRFALIEVLVTADENHMRFEVSYNRHMQKKDQIMNLIKRYEKILNACVDELLSAKIHRSLSDFPFLNTTYEGLDNLMEEMHRQLEVGPEDVEDMYPCSPMQQRILRHQKEVAGSYNVQNIWRVSATHHMLQINRLKMAWQDVVVRHSALRTIFTRSDSALYPFNQVVHRRPNTVIKHSGIDVDDSSAVEFIAKQPSLIFGPLLPTHQLSLYTSTAGTIYVKLEISHALIDGFSNQVLLRDLQLAYEGQLVSGAGPLYSNFIAYMIKDNHEESLAYWSSYIHDISPCNMPVNAVEIHNRGDLCSVEISMVQLTSKLYAASKLHEVTVANIFMTAWAVVLHIFTKSPQVCFGYLVSGRDVPIERIEDAVGLYINLVPSKCNIVKDITLQQLLTAVHEDYARSSTHQHFTLTETANGDSIGKPLFNTAVSFQKDSSSSVQDGPEESLVLDRLWSMDPTEVSHSLRFVKSSWLTFCIV